ncbi:MAG: UDP-N-acetylmuramoyl-tripeptide--D-alanyl-D-alanine ligase [Bacteroidales bacterium]|nr:UDP-N-acetylmuramoyl-tripeptide--D-alanyl-D-alanine ligase [Bacteroidales bacterium]
MNIENIYSIFEQCNFTVCTDTRKIIKDSLFIALKGELFNANQFVEEAIRQGCRYAIADEYQGQNEQVVVVDNVLKTLQELAHYHRKQMKAKILGITGTNGKTTTKELIAAVLKEKYNIIYTQGNFNNHIGVPLTLLTIRPETEIAIVEMGANHPGEIDFLCSIAEPDYGIITNVGKAHLEGFGSFEGVVKTKTELYRYIKTKNGLVFVNYDNKILLEHAMHLPNFSYGTNNLANIVATHFEAKPTLLLNWKMQNSSIVYTVNTHLIGKYNWENVLASIAIGSYFGLDPKAIIQGIENYIPTNHRSQWLTIGTNHILMDAYNANPTSMQLALNNFVALPFENKCLILGDMRELGAYEENEHQTILNLLEQHSYKQVFLVGPVFTKLNKNKEFLTFNSVEHLMEYLKENKLANSTILIKGSHGIHLEKLMNFFNEQV